MWGPGVILIIVLVSDFWESKKAFYINAFLERQMRAALIADFCFCGTRVVAERVTPQRWPKLCFCRENQNQRNHCAVVRAFCAYFPTPTTRSRSKKEKRWKVLEGDVTGYLYFGLDLGLSILPYPRVTESNRCFSCLGTGTLQGGSTSQEIWTRIEKGARLCSSARYCIMKPPMISGPEILLLESGRNQNSMPVLLIFFLHPSSTLFPFLVSTILHCWSL